MKPETPLEKLVFGLILLAAVIVAGFLVLRPFPGIGGTVGLLMVAVLIAHQWMVRRRKREQR